MLIWRVHCWIILWINKLIEEFGVYGITTKFVQHLNEWSFISFHTDLCEHTAHREGATWSAYNEIYSANSLNVVIRLTTDNRRVSNRLLSWSWQISYYLDLKIVLPHICQILRFMNKTPPKSIMLIGSEHIIVPHT